MDEENRELAFNAGLVEGLVLAATRDLDLTGGADDDVDALAEQIHDRTLSPVIVDEALGPGLVAGDDDTELMEKRIANTDRHAQEPCKTQEALAPEARSKERTAEGRPSLCPMNPVLAVADGIALDLKAKPSSTGRGQSPAIVATSTEIHTADTVVAIFEGATTKGTEGQLRHAIDITSSRADQHPQLLPRAMNAMKGALARGRGANTYTPSQA